ncbi:unnamed protein product [Periconia digitata]|uniref:Uncharacterized protein n=1 Tax=Periconia digitata TaxID=1303443 RepID=A0A9W4UEN4_9PLEO|nr:unnamed protein product [Periconia digitata]
MTNPRAQTSTSGFEDPQHQSETMWYKIRDESFGPDSYISNFIKHTVRQHDLEVTVYNTALDGKRHTFHAKSATVDTAKIRHEKQAKQLVKRMRDTIKIINDSRQSFILAAKEKMLQLQEDFAQHGRHSIADEMLKMTKAAYEYAESSNKPYEFNATEFLYIASVAQLPGYKPLFRELSFEAKRMYLGMIAHKNRLVITAHVLWPVRNIIERPTLKELERYIYKFQAALYAVVVGDLAYDERDYDTHVYPRWKYLMRNHSPWNAELETPLLYPRLKME